MTSRYHNTEKLGSKQTRVPFQNGHAFYFLNWDWGESYRRHLQIVISRCKLCVTKSDIFGDEH